MSRQTVLAFPFRSSAGGRRLEVQKLPLVSKPNMLSRSAVYSYTSRIMPKFQPSRFRRWPARPLRLSSLIEFNPVFCRDTMSPAIQPELSATKNFYHHAQADWMLPRSPSSSTFVMLSKGMPIFVNQAATASLAGASIMQTALPSARLAKLR